MGAQKEGELGLAMMSPQWVFFFIASEIDSCLFSVGAQGEGELGVAMIPPAVADTKGGWPVITAWSVAVFCGFLDL